MRFFFAFLYISKCTYSLKKTQSSWLPPVYAWSPPVYACHKCNLRGTSAEETHASCLPKETGRHTVIPPTQLMQHFRWSIFQLTLGNRCISLHVTPPQKKNSCDTPKESYHRYPTYNCVCVLYFYSGYIIGGGCPFCLPTSHSAERFSTGTVSVFLITGFGI